MNIDLMRDIDYWVGVPLCFVFTWIDRLLGLIRIKSLPKPARVLFIELSEMGSAILADPCLRRTRDSGCELYFLIFKKNKISLKLLNTVKDENVFVLREENIFLLLWDSIRFALWCRRNEIDSCVDLELFSRVTALLTWLSFAKNKVGFHKYHNEGLYRGEMLTHRVPYNPNTHIAHNFMNLVESLIGGVSSDGFLKRPLSAADRQVTKADFSILEKTRVREKLKKRAPLWNERSPFVLVNPNAGDFLPQRKWPLKYFAELIQKLINEREDLWVFLTGSPAESAEIEKVLSQVPIRTRVVNMSGAVEFTELPILYSLSPILITNDSGPGHFSSVTNIHSFVFFGPETPNLYGSLGSSTAFFAGLSCSPCVSAWNHRKTSCTDNQCLKVLTPDVVWPQIREKLVERLEKN